MGDKRQYVDSPGELHLNFRGDKCKVGVCLVVDDGHADGAVVMLFAVVVVMECLGHKGEEE